MLGFPAAAGALRLNRQRIPVRTSGLTAALGAAPQTRHGTVKRGKQPQWLPDRAQLAKVGRVLMWYEIEETGGYFAARDLLVRRCEAWAVASGLAMSPLLAAALLDSRHFSSDGRLGYWSPAQVRRALLEWIPEKVTASREDLLEAPGTLRTLLRYLDAHGLRDPRGASAGENESAIDAAEKEFADALGDRGRYGTAKTVAMSALDCGVDIGDPQAVAAFLVGVQEGRVTLDQNLLEHALERQLTRPDLEERKFAQLPVRLPAAEELHAAAQRSKVTGQLRALVDWLGPAGRALTQAGMIRPADARELITLLGTGDEGLRFRSAAELPGLHLIVTWAKKARLVRRQGTRLVPVAKARPVLADPDALWQRAFEAAFDIGDAVCRPIWPGEPASPVRFLYDVIVPDVLATIYSMEEPVPLARLAESVWDSVRAHFDVDSLSPLSQSGLRGRADNDLEHIFDAFEALGAVTSVQGVASDMFSADLDETSPVPPGEQRPFSGERAAALRERLAAPGRLVSLTPCRSCARSWAPCSQCGQPSRLRAGTREKPLCGSCAAPGTEWKTCPGCGTGERLVAGACRRCHLHNQLAELLTDPATGGVRAGLQAFQQALADAERPEIALGWLRRPKVRALLTELAAGQHPLTHATLDGLPASKTLTHLRSVLVATGALPGRDEHLAQLERWIASAMAARADPQEKEVLHRYAVWHVLRRLRHRISGRHATHGQAAVARRNVQAAVAFLDWLAARGLALTSCTQASLDAWMAAASPSQRGPTGNFVRWARNQKLTTASFPATRWSGPARVIDIEARWEQARWLLHDDSVRPEDRVAGLLVLLYAQQPAAISRLTAGHVQASGGQVCLMLGRDPVVLPEPLASLILQVAATGRGHAVIGEHGSSPWLLPGGRPGQPISPYRWLNGSTRSASTPGPPAPPRCSSSPPNCPPRSSPACSASTSKSRSPGNTPAPVTG
jgi:hypothetical protein